MDDGRSTTVITSSSVLPPSTILHPHLPELPEVEYAAQIARKFAVGRVITRVATLHPSQRRALPPARARTLVGERVLRVERHGKTQRFRLTSGRGLDVHFRMTGDWAPGSVAEPLPRFARAVLEFDDGGRLVLDDPRALSVLSIAAANSNAPAILGPDPTTTAFDVDTLAAALATRRIPIKVALLDQRVVAGLGNIYAAESLWLAAIDPRRPALSIPRKQLAKLVRAIRQVLSRATRNVVRYYAGGASSSVRFNVYDREGRPCRRCGGPIARITQAARSTYFCPRCQR